MSKVFHCLNSGMSGFGDGQPVHFIPQERGDASKGFLTNGKIESHNVGEQQTIACSVRTMQGTTHGIFQGMHKSHPGIGERHAAEGSGQGHVFASLQVIGFLAGGD